MTKNTMICNRAKHKLKSGKTVVVTARHSGSADSIDLLGSPGFDGFWLEGEHGAITGDRFGDMTRACDLWGMSVLCRIRNLDRARINTWCTRYCGASG